MYGHPRANELIAIMTTTQESNMQAIDQDNVTTKSLKMRAAEAAPVIRPFLSRSQLSVMGDACRGEEKEFFMLKFISLAKLIQNMPGTYAQDGMGDAAVAHLHYFLGGSDWYITEKDMQGGVQQAFGFAILNGDIVCAEIGYISIDELVRHGAELDLYWLPATLGDIKTQRARNLG
jgi:hypothetical protein